MTGHRLTLICSLAVGISFTTMSLAFGDGDSLFRTRLDQARINLLVQVIQADPDENKRNAAVTEMSRADPRLSTGVIQIITEALLKDPSAKVRLTAIGVLVKYKTVFSLAGLALETTMESDPVPAVRKAAKQALWDYHLIGYKSARDMDEFTRQTAEPPIAKPAPKPIPITSEPAVIPAAVKLKPTATTQLPPLGQSPGPRVSLTPQQFGPITMLTAIPPHRNLTVEPPLAPNESKSVSPPIVKEPPILPHWPGPLSTGTPHPFAADLPPIVSPPESNPGAASIPEIKIEPPLNKPVPN